MVQFLRSHLRWLAVPVALILVASGLTFYFVRPSTAHAATPSANLPITLLLVHGYTDTCDDAFNETDQAANAGPNATTTINYLTQHGWAASNIDDVGYYDPSKVVPVQLYNQSYAYESDGLRGQSATDNAGHTAYGQCDHNLWTFTHNDPNHDASFCPNIPYIGLQGTTNDNVETLGCALAWYIYDNYTLLGRPVSVLTHSMGGLLIRDAIGESGNSTGYPPALDVRNVVTVAAPHGGLGGGYLINARKYSPSPEVEDMAVGSSFMNMLGTPQFQAPHGKYGTHWALMGADAPCGGLDRFFNNPTSILECTVSDNSGRWPSGDGIVQGESTMAMTSDFKVFYGQGEFIANAQATPQFFKADLNTEYSHEANSCHQYTFIIQHPGCLVYSFYLNDGTDTSETVNAWICTSSCTTNIADITANGTDTAYHSLAEIFSQLGATSIPLTTHPLVLRSNANSNYVSAELGYTGNSYGMLRARAASQGPWEMWTEAVLPNGNIALLSNANNDFVSTEVDNTGSTYGELRARSATIGPWEIYQIQQLTADTYALKSVANNDYVSAELGYTGGNYAMLRARGTAIGPWETFTDSTGAVGCTNYDTLTIGPNGCTGFSVAGNAYPGTDHGWYAGGGVGLKGQEIWTYGNGTVQDSTATYSFTGLGTFYAYQIEAYIPNEHSDATHVHYHIHSAGGGDTDRYINQENFTNQWDTTDLGFVCTSDGNATITIADNGGDNAPLMVGADAIQLVNTTHRCYFG